MANGFTSFNLGTLDTLTDVVVQPDGRILASGHTRVNGNDDWVVVRFNPNGSLDTTFGSGGVVVTPVTPAGDTAHSIILQPDGKIIVGGESSDSAFAPFTLVRYNSNGAVDTSFGGGDGIDTIAGGSTSGGIIRDLALQADGKIVASGNWGGANNNMAVMRFNADGTPDATFGTTAIAGPGITVHPAGLGQSSAAGVLVEPDGSVVVVGWGTDNSAPSGPVGFAVARFTSAGVVAGEVVTQIGAGSDVAAKVLRQPDGKIIVIGYASDSVSNNSTQDFAIVRYNSNLTLDTSFGGGDGIVRTDINGNNSASPATSVVMQADGKIVVGGVKGNPTGGSDFALVRYNTDGTLDTTFGGTGIVTVNVGTSADEVNGIAIQSDGRIVAVGFNHMPLTGVGNQQDFVIARFNTDGSLDTTFDGNASAVLNGGPGVDVIFASGGTQYVYGAEGNDTLVGNANIFALEPDTLFGEGGDDAIYAEKSDAINGGTGTDVVYAVNAFDFTLDMGATSFEIAQMDFGNDFITAATQTVGVTVVASGGNDTIVGSAFADILFGGVGNDTIQGGFGDDGIVGDLGIDSLDGGEGNDLVYFDNQDSFVFGGNGFDAGYITSGPGVTVNTAASSLEFIQDLAGGNDTILGSTMTTALIVASGGGNDTVEGGAFADLFYGGEGNDILTGNGGSDTLVGQAGTDTLSGGAGIDVLYGNAGSGGDGVQDIFKFQHAGAANADAVYDFQAGIDKIDLTAFGGNTFANVSILDGGGSSNVYLNGQLICTVVGAAGTLTFADFFI